MKRILCPDWLPEAHLGIARFVPAKAKFFGVIFWQFNKSFIDRACLVKTAGHWPCSFFRFYGPRRSRKKKEGKKKNLVNIEPSLPHAW